MSETEIICLFSIYILFEDGVEDLSLFNIDGKFTNMYLLDLHVNIDKEYSHSEN